MELFLDGPVGWLLNWLGGTLRWCYGFVWRSLFRAQKFNYSEYFNGRKDIDDKMESLDHSFVNKLVAVAFIVLLVVHFVAP